MTPIYKTTMGELFVGNVLEVLKKLEDESVQMCVTSPPYWGLRDYGIPFQVWDCEVECDHEWGEEKSIPTGRHDDGRSTDNFHGHADGYGGAEKTSTGQFCQKCGAWLGSYGLEPTPELFIEHSVQIFREVKRVLRKDGTLWLNIGDSYAQKDTRIRPESFKDLKERADRKGYDTVTTWGSNRAAKTAVSGLKNKDLCMIPAKVAIALQADGWYLRSVMPWVKRSAMPESATDRPANALEYVYLLTKSPKYFFDMNAIRVPYTKPLNRWAGNKVKDGVSEWDVGTGQNAYREGRDMRPNKAGRNFRNTDFFFQSIEPPYGMIFAGGVPVGLDVNPQAVREAHFATFPEKLAETCIKAGTSEMGCCPECKTPYKRIVEKGYPDPKPRQSHEKYDGKDAGLGTNPGVGRAEQEIRTIGWDKTCTCVLAGTSEEGACSKCGAPFERIIEKGELIIPDKSTVGKKYSNDDQTGWSDDNFKSHAHYENKMKGWKSTCECEADVEPCVVLDPFFGSGTTGLVCEKTNRKWIGIDLSDEFCKIAKLRINPKYKENKEAERKLDLFEDIFQGGKL